MSPSEVRCEPTGNDAANLVDTAVHRRRRGSAGGELRDDVGGACRTCGPIVSVVDAVRRGFSSAKVRFIHVEGYRDNDHRNGFNRWVRQWGCRANRGLSS